jgi:hypothetical protein
MKMLKDCSEVREARELLLEIMREPAPAGAVRVAPLPHPPAQIAVRPAGIEDLLPPEADGPALEDEAGRVTPALEAEPEPLEHSTPSLPWPPAEPEGSAGIEQVALQSMGVSDQRESVGRVSEDSSRGDRLQSILTILCAREGLAGALLTDSSGLPLAASSSIGAHENLAAFSTVLGDALLKAGSYLGQDGASDVSLDINATQKVVLHRFDLEARPYYLLVLCDPDFEPRYGMRGVVPEILAILAVS